MNAQGLIVYSSLTGTTRRLATAVYEELKKDCAIYSVDEVPVGRDYPWIIAGFWVNHGRADRDFLDYLGRLEGQNICLIGTLGADPDSAHGHRVMASMRSLVEEKNRFLGGFLCGSQTDASLKDQDGLCVVDKGSDPPRRLDARMLEEVKAYCREAVRSL